MPVSLFGPLLREIDGRFAGVELTVQHGPAAALNKQLLRGEIDAAVLDDPDALDERVSHWPLYQDRLAILMPAGHGLSAYSEVPAAVLSGERLVARAWECRLARVLDALTIEHRMGDAPRCYGADEAAVHGLVLSGLGLALCTVRQPVLAGLTRRPLAPPAEPFPVVLAVAAGRPASQASEVFVQLARVQDWAA